MEKAATDIYTFENLRNGGFTYVDKTAILKELADLSRGAQFFIARPRRFGKSLAVSTLRCLFEGKREYFGGLAIESQWDWSKKWKVLHLDMGSAQTETVPELKKFWRSMLADECMRNKIAFRDDENPAVAFKNVLNDLAAESDDGQAVVLIDEYDKPLLGHLMTPKVTEFKNALKAFYSVLKTLESRQRFTFITGVSKFSKVSIFSDLNNLEDMTLDAATATLFGYTHDEVKRFFPQSIAALGEKLGKSPEEMFDEIVKWYDGYRFHQDAEPVINPVSLGLCFKKKELGNWWSLTAMPTFLLEFFKARPMDVSDLSVTEADLTAYEPEKIKPVTLLFQTGYLTIRGCEQTGGMIRYNLKFPNMEVENSFLTDLSALYIGNDNSGTANIAAEVIKALQRRDPEGFVESFRQFFAAIPYDLTDRQNEQSWQAIMYAVLRVIGINADGEVRTYKGRIDLTVETAMDAYIIEVKRDSTAKKAIEQIQAKEYTDRFRLSGKPITLIGMAFSTKRRTISGVKIVKDA
ncbi:MAG: ATP-binding protein [Kiritimatiellae bacterium]|nr:ATP-binding protein [Kiritimatiellia bacterium]